MPSPFPGMDPYLESPDLWRGVHQALIYCINAALNATLPAGFVAKMDERVYIATPDRSVYPDVAVGETGARPTGRLGGGGPAAAEAPVASVADAPRRVQVRQERIREGFIQVRAVDGDRELYTVIEVLSPTNKAPGDGRREYRAKQAELLGGPVALLEIDLLRSGRHTVGVPDGALRADGAIWDYLVCLHRGGSAAYDYWPVALRERLPRVSVPLADGVPDAVLDLQAALTRVYDEGAFASLIDYAAHPEPPLSASDAAWADALLRERGLRPAVGEDAGG